MSPGLPSVEPGPSVYIDARLLDRRSRGEEVNGVGKVLVREGVDGATEGEVCDVSLVRERGREMELGF